MYTTKEQVRRTYYNERDYILADRFYPGELGLVIMLGIASLLVWSLCIWGITSDYQHDIKVSYNNTYDTGYTEVR